MDASTVLVVGAGPTGLTAALVLAASGVAVRIVDAAPAPSTRSRALVVQARTLELLDRLGLAQGLVAAGHPCAATHLYTDGRPLLRVPIDVRMPTDTPFLLVLFVSQVEVESRLRGALAAQGVSVASGVRVTGLVQHPDRVEVTFDGAPAAAYPWVIGADGAHSIVRHSLGLSFDGAPYRSDFLMGDVVVDAEVDTDAIHVFLARTGVAVLFPMPGPRTRVIATDPAPEEGPLTLQELNHKANRMADRDWSLSDPDWLARFRLHHRGVPAYRVGRAFVAGDAAHIHSPAGGQGMNTGIGDAFNLAWKLAMVVRHDADPALLDTYHQERHPVGRRLLSFTDRAFSVATQDNRAFTAVRNRVLPWLVPVLVTEARQAAVLRFVSQIGIRYRVTDLAGSDGGFAGGPRPGDRVDDRRCIGLSWWLLGTGAPGGHWRRRVDTFAAGFPWIQVSWRAPDTDTASGELLLVRPDGHLAFRSSGPRLDPLAAFLGDRVVG